MGASEVLFELIKFFAKVYSSSPPGEAAELNIYSVPS